MSKMQCNQSSVNFAPDAINAQTVNRDIRSNKYTLTAIDEAQDTGLGKQTIN